MREREEDHDESARLEAESGGAGDVESAGETVAADATGGDTTDSRPVGADTLVRVDEKTKEEMMNAE
jgi:hypothetical protein